MEIICPLLPGHKSSLEDIRLLDSDKITAEEKLEIARALRNICPDSKFLYQCIDASAKKLYYGVDCSRFGSRPNSDCDCSTDPDLNAFCNSLKSKPVFKEEEIQYFANVIIEKLNEELIRHSKCSDFRKCKKKIPEYKLVPVQIIDSESTSTESCSCISERSSLLEILRCLETEKKKCLTRDKSIPFRHCGDLLRIPSDSLDAPTEPFKIGYVGKSEEIGKWGRFYDMVDRVLLEYELALGKMRFQRGTKHWCGHEESVCCDDVCTMPLRTDRFDDVDRFKRVEMFGFSMFCRNLMRWSNCITKRWDCITRFPHLVIHLPSMSYPCNLRCTARKQFASLQNIQIGRIGWLVNKNAQVMYVCPGKSNFETECTLQNFVRNARPDISLEKLWIIVNDEECLCDEVEEEYRSGCENLFYTPNVYRRVRHLSAGRHGFIIPGVLCKTDVFIACELRTSIIGPCLKFQERLLNKHYVMSFLSESNVPHPPFAGVRNFSDLCETMSRMMIGLPQLCRRKWLLKVNCGFCGKQSALICLDCDECCMSKENMKNYLADVLPQKIKLNKKAYKDAKDFFVEIEQHGGVLTICPASECRTVSLGCFIEHDTAQACLRTAADVIQTCSDGGWTDVGYVIPQSALPMTTIRKLVVELGKKLLLEQYIGFFGVDLVVFRDVNEELNYWVVDIDPYYTDLISFDDWRRFCLNIPSTARFSAGPSSSAYDNYRSASLTEKNHRYVVCSGKLYMDGLSHCSGNFLVDLFEEHNIGYSSKVTHGV